MERSDGLTSANLPVLAHGDSDGNLTRNKRHTLYYDASNYEKEASKETQQQTYQVVLLGTEYIESQKLGEKDYTTYRLRVTHKNGTKWATCRRYSEFRHLLEKLKSKYGGAVVPRGFPPKKILRNMTPLLIDRRHIALQTWMDKVLKTETISTSTEVIAFLEENKIAERLVEISFEDTMVRLDLEKMGYLWQIKNKQWKKRWFILRHGILYKYTSHEEKNPSHQYVCRNAVVEIVEETIAKGKERKFCFKVNQKRKEHFFSAESEEDQNEWIAAFQGFTDEGMYDGLSAESAVLGVALEDMEQVSTNGIPIFLTSLMDYLEATSKGTKLFVATLDPQLVTQIQEGNVDFSLLSDPHTIAGLIQIFLRELPSPIIHVDLQSCFLGVGTVSNDRTKIQVLSALVKSLELPYYNTLRRLSELLHILAGQDEELVTHFVTTFSVLIFRAKEGSVVPYDLKTQRLLQNIVTRLFLSHWESILPSYKLLPARDSCMVGIGDFHVLELIGKGGFGKVWKVRKKSDGKIYAMKSLQKKSLLEQNLVEHTIVEREIMMNAGSHPHIISLYYAFQTDTELCFVMEYVGGGSLLQLLEQTPELSEMEVKFYAAEILLGIEALHERKIVYRDLKLENILITSSGHCLLSDFGLAAIMSADDDRIHSFSGSSFYLAPEILMDKTGEGHGASVDFWGFGVLLHLLFTGAPPFWCSNHKKLFDMIRYDEFVHEEESEYSEAAADLLTSLLIKDPSKRLCSISSIKAHPFFKDVNWKKVLKLKAKPPHVPLYDITEDARLKFSKEDATKPVETEDVEIDTDVFPNFSYVNTSYQDNCAKIRAANAAKPRKLLLSEMSRFFTKKTV